MQRKHNLFAPIAMNFHDSSMGSLYLIDQDRVIEYQPHMYELLAPTAAFAQPLASFYPQDHLSYMTAANLQAFESSDEVDKLSCAESVSETYNHTTCNHLYHSPSVFTQSQSSRITTPSLVEQGIDLSGEESYLFGLKSLPATPQDDKQATAMLHRPSAVWANKLASTTGQARSTNSSRKKSTLSGSPTPAPRQKGRQPHKLVEKKYRQNLNRKIEVLGAAISASGVWNTEHGPRHAPTRRKKSHVLDDAIKYVSIAEASLKQMDDKIARLSKQSYLVESRVNRCARHN